jgi:hypothetical protein
VISGGNGNDSQDYGFAGAVGGRVVAGVCAAEEAIEVLCAESGAYVRRKKQRRRHSGIGGGWRWQDRWRWRKRGTAERRGSARSWRCHAAARIY